MSSNVLFRELIKKNKEDIKAIIVSSSVSGSFFSRLKKYYRLFKRMSLRFFIYKVVESLVYVQYMRIIRLFNRKDYLMKDLAKRHDIPFLYIKNINEPEQVIKIKEFKPDLMLCYSPPILRKYVIDIPKKGCLNGHGSLLPHYRGAAQYFWYLINNDKKGGATVQFMVEKLDMGDIIVQKEFDIEKGDSAYSLHYKIAKLLEELFEETIGLFRKGEVRRTKQGKGSYCPIPIKKDMKRFGKKKIIRIREFFNYV